MTERVVRFGSDDNLLGVLTEPPTSSADSDVPAVLWLNAGTLHHIGPFGWYVTLARRLAEHGLLNFRFDLSGIGESPLPRTGTSGDAEGFSPIDRAGVDVTAAMDFLARKRQVRRFVLIGLCSGAVLAHHVAVRDERVAGAVLLDGYGYRTSGYFLRHYAARALRLRTWLGQAGRLLRKLTRQEDRKEPVSLLSESYFFDFPPREQARAELTQLVRRGTTRLLFLYSGGLAEHYFNHRRQFAEMFGRLDPTSDRVEVEYSAEADHLYSAHTHRQALFARIETWMRRFQEAGSHATL